jgi:hypothetical protein
VDTEPQTPACLSLPGADQIPLSEIATLPGECHTSSALEGKTETISSKVRNKTNVSTLIQHSLGISSQRNKTQRNKRNIKERKKSNYPCLQMT